MKIELQKGSKYLEQFDYVLKARSKEATRYTINYLLVKQDRIVATDGRRLHFADITGIGDTYAPGQYEVLKHNRTNIVLLKVDADKMGNFPKYDILIPDYGQWFESEEYPSIVCALGKIGWAFNPDFLSAACIPFKNAKVFYSLESDKLDERGKQIAKPLLIKYEGEKLVAIIMPVEPYITYFTKATAGLKWEFSGGGECSICHRADITKLDKDEICFDCWKNLHSLDNQPAQPLTTN